MSWTFTTSGAAVAKAGVNANSTITTSGAILDEWSDQAEAVINAETRKDWTTNYASLSDNFKKTLAHAATALIAMNIISYDMSNYTSRLEAQTMLDVLRDQYRGAIDFLKNKQNQEKF